MNGIELGGNLIYKPDTDAWSGSGNGWWIEKTHENTAKVTFEERIVFHDDAHRAERPQTKSYTLSISKLSGEGDIQTYQVGEDGFFVKWTEAGDGPCMASFTVVGTKVSFVPDDRELCTDDSVADIYATQLLFQYEAKYGVITLMGSASISCESIVKEKLDILDSHVNSYQSAIAAEKDALGQKVLQDKLEMTHKRMDRHRSIATKSAQYWDSAMKFGELWGHYAAHEQEQALDGRYVPLCTGGGPGIMRAAAQGARRQNAHVVGIDCQFGYDNFFNLKDSYSVYSNQRLRMNNFSIREGVLINYSHVILFWPGGFGTAWEVFETLSKISTNHLRRRRTKVIFVHSEYWEPLFRFVDQMRAFGAVNSWGDRIKIPGVDDADPDDAYLAEVVDTAEEAFEKTRAFVELLHQRNQLNLRG